MGYFMLCERYHVSFKMILKDQNLNVFLGCEVMGLSTIINMLYYLRPRWYIATYVLWWINVTLSLLAGWGITFIMIGYNKFSMKEANATILLPCVTMTVVSSTGSLISQSMMNRPGFQLSQDIITFLLWSNAVILATVLICFYFNKLLLHGLPAKEVIYTCFIPIGILGQGGWAIQLNYKNLGNLIVNGSGLKLLNLDVGFSEEYLQTISATLNILGICVALFLAAFGVCLTALSFLAVVYCGRPPVWIRTMWASTFPLGTMALSFNEMYLTTKLTGFQVISTIYSVMLILITTYCIIGTVLFDVPYKDICNIIRSSKKE
ncbi:hypothetical protein FOA43_003563 [Brettanomyces nanus]|uniref:Sulfite efflux pump SSU1 n=1 Tax=Eeniella nana TaxID=13502 RepID=A0A875RW99_EENNA|nr:uncharacterized protein FOA43_003563 [Brettanomyces nanus]QPG76177.1 hypothetical protein FOA43_003563 [Brettanomyces nanus]